MGILYAFCQLSSASLALLHHAVDAEFLASIVIEDMAWPQICSPQCEDLADFCCQRLWRRAGRLHLPVQWSLPWAARSPRAAPSTESGLEALVSLYHRLQRLVFA